MAEDTGSSPVETPDGGGFDWQQLIKDPAILAMMYLLGEYMNKSVEGELGGNPYLQGKEYLEGRGAETSELLNKVLTGQSQNTYVNNMRDTLQSRQGQTFETTPAPTTPRVDPYSDPTYGQTAPLASRQGATSQLSPLDATSGQPSRFSQVGAPIAPAGPNIGATIPLTPSPTVGANAPSQFNPYPGDFGQPSELRKGLAPPVANIGATPPGQFNPYQEQHPGLAPGVNRPTGFGQPSALRKGLTPPTPPTLNAPPPFDPYTGNTQYGQPDPALLQMIYDIARGGQGGNINANRNILQGSLGNRFGTRPQGGGPITPLRRA